MGSMGYTPARPIVAGTRTGNRPRINALAAPIDGRGLDLPDTIVAGG